LKSKDSPDWLVTSEEALCFSGPRLNARHTHGTGCTLSAALAALRPQRSDWKTTIQDAKNWLTQALTQADRLAVGRGIGPLHHFHQWW
jgi:hydroxymethylpyrimidine/phosphomethylpyrimidine kinase